jgi:hypothetical protein
VNVDSHATRAVFTERVVDLQPEVLDDEILVLVERDGTVVPCVIYLVCRFLGDLARNTKRPLKEG